MQHFSVADVTVHALGGVADPHGGLVALTENENVPFRFARAFYIWETPAEATRGNHAHYRCNQFMVCLNGKVYLTCDDGTHTSKFELSNPKIAVNVPPTIWSHQTYESSDTILLVLCDRPYEEDDYIRDRDAFLRFRGVSETPA